MFADTLGRQLAIGWIAGIAHQRGGARGVLRVRSADRRRHGLRVRRVARALPGCSIRSCAAIAARRCASRSQPRAGCVAAILAGSALQLAAAPRADQPLIDLAEYAMPPLRSLYFTAAEQAAFADAGAYAERYRREAEQLNERERRNRTEGEALDDFSVARISSFLKSYGEMRKGEQFVMDEVRARARERMRWGASLALLVLALLFAPVPWRRRWLQPASRRHV